jgi:hypothetical protein
MSSYDCDSDYDDAEDGRRQLEEFVMYCLEIERKAELLLTHSGASYLASLFAGAIVRTVRRDAALDDKTDLALLDVLEGTLAEYILTQAIIKHEGVLNQPLTRSGLIAMRKTIDAACVAFEALLAADVAK